MPEDVLPGAKTVLVVFVPFSKELAETNSCAGLASAQWAKAYEDTNAMFGAMNEDLIALLAKHGVRSAVAQAASTFDREKLVSHWSHRHFAYLAGLGTFGINNMLITRSGGCGRYTTVVTNLDITPGQPAPLPDGGADGIGRHLALRPAQMLCHPEEKCRSLSGLRQLVYE